MNWGRIGVFTAMFVIVALAALTPREELNAYHGIKATIESVYADHATGVLHVKPIAKGIPVTAGLEHVSGASEWTIPECAGT
jgi:hypothetical protein